MKRARWRNHVGLPVLLLSALMSTAVMPAAITAGLMPAITRADCGSLTPAAAARTTEDVDDGRVRWARVAAQIAKRGDLVGSVMTARIATGATLSIALPNESFVAPAMGDVVVYARDSASASEVRVLSLTTGCDVRLISTAEVARSAILDPSGAALYVHAVTRAERNDLGVARYDLMTGSSAMVLPPLKSVADVGIGLVFGTELAWSVDGSHLAVQSCGFSSCATRVLDVASDEFTSYDEPGQGALLGLSNDHLVTFADCLGLPCDVLSTDLVSRAVTTLSPLAVDASFEAGDDGRGTVEITTAAGTLEVMQ
jgi:hypothetical protein